MEATFRRTFSSFAVHNFRLYFLGQGISLCGTWMQTIALSWLVLQLTHSGAKLGLVTAAQFLPILLFGLLGGVIADRFDKRKVLYFTQSMLGILALLLGLLVVNHVVQLWEVYVIAACMGMTTVIDNPSRQTFVVEMVGPERLRNAISLNSTIVNLARIIGPSFAAIIIATVGVGECFLINAASYIAVLIALALMRKRELRPTPPAKNDESGGVVQGLKYVWSEPRLRSTLLMMVIIGTFTYEFPVVMPLFATITLHGNAATYSAISAAMGLGAVVGGLYTAGKKEIAQSLLITVAVLFGLSMMLISIMPTLITALLLIVVMGMLSIIFIALGNTTLQLTSQPQMRGRVMSLWSMAFQGTTPIGGPIIGVLIDHTNPRIGIFVGGLAALVAAIAGTLATRRSKKLQINTD
ncbi:MAG: MFS transporter [Candidatus Saccharimonadales bacterium]